MSLAILFHFLCAQHVSDINISIIRSLRLFSWITTLVVLFLVGCMLEFPCGWVGLVSVLQSEACNTDTNPTQPHGNSNIHRTKNNTTNVVIQLNSRKLLMMGVLMSETCWAHKKWKLASDMKLVLYSSTITMMHGPINITDTEDLSLIQSYQQSLRPPHSHIRRLNVISSLQDNNTPFKDIYFYVFYVWRRKCMYIWRRCG